MPDEVIHDKEDFRFYLPFEQEEAELTYTYPESEVMDFDHTYVPKKCRGQGVADQLVRCGLEFARCNNYKIIPSCPVVETYIKRYPEYKELVQPE